MAIIEQNRVYVDAIRPVYRADLNTGWFLDVPEAFKSYMLAIDRKAPEGSGWVIQVSGHHYNPGPGRNSGPTNFLLRQVIPRFGTPPVRALGISHPVLGWVSEPDRDMDWREDRGPSAAASIPWLARARPTLDDTSGTSGGGYAPMESSSGGGYGSSYGPPASMTGGGYGGGYSAAARPAPVRRGEGEAEAPQEADANRLPHPVRLEARRPGEDPEEIRKEIEEAEKGVPPGSVKTPDEKELMKAAKKVLDKAKTSTTATPARRPQHSRARRPRQLRRSRRRPRRSPAVTRFPTARRRPGPAARPSRPLRDPITRRARVTMDIKDITRQAVKYRFWILVGVAALLPMIAYFTASGSLKAETQSKAKAIEDADKKVKQYATPGIPNASYKTVVEEKTQTVGKDIDASWKVLYDRQAPLLSWPTPSSRRNSAHGAASGRTPRGRHQQLQDAILEYVQAFEAYVDRVYAVFKPFNSEDGTGIVAAPSRDDLLLPPLFSETDLPELGVVWATQERLWLQRVPPGSHRRGQQGRDRLEQRRRSSRSTSWRWDLHGPGPGLGRPERRTGPVAGLKKAAEAAPAGADAAATDSVAPAPGRGRTRPGRRRRNPPTSWRSRPIAISIGSTRSTCRSSSNRDRIPDFLAALRNSPMANRQIREVEINGRRPASRSRRRARYPPSPPPAAVATAAPAATAATAAARAPTPTARAGCPRPPV